MEIGKRFAEKRMRDAADLRKNIRFGIASTLYCRKASVMITIKSMYGAFQGEVVHLTIVLFIACCHPIIMCAG